VFRERHESVWLKRKEDFSKAIPLRSAPDAVDSSSTSIAMRRIAVSIDKPLMTAYGTFQPVVDPPIYGRCQGNSCHWMQVWLLCAQELPLWMTGIFGSN